MGALLALASSLMWGVGDFLAGELSRRRAAFAVAGAAQVVGLVFMLAVSVLSGAWGLGIDPSRYAGWSVLAALAGLGGLVCFYTALGSGPMGIVSPIAALGVLVPLAVGLAQGDQPTRWQMTGILLAVVGVVLASGPELSGGASARPVALAVLAALLFGLFMVFAAKGSESSPVLTLTVQRLTSSVIVCSAALLARTLGGLQRGDAPQLAVIGVLDVGANLAFSYASTLGMLAVVSVLGSVYPVVTVVLAWLVLAERLRPVQYVGSALTITAIVMIAVA